MVDFQFFITINNVIRTQIFRHLDKYFERRFLKIKLLGQRGALSSL
jgi:hypothetical protein